MMDVNEREVAVMKRVLLKLCGGAALAALIWRSRAFIDGKHS